MLDPRLSHLEHEPVLGVPKDPTGFERHCSLGLVAGAMRSKQSPVSAGDGVRAVDGSYGKEQHIYRRGQQLWMVIPLDLSWRDLSTVCLRYQPRPGTVEGSKSVCPSLFQTQ